jgi:hypothetical protein
MDCLGTIFRKKTSSTADINSKFASLNIRFSFNFDVDDLQDLKYRRFGSTIDLDLAVKHYGHWKDRLDGLRKRLEELNHHKRKEVKIEW